MELYHAMLLDSLSADSHLQFELLIRDPSDRLPLEEEVVYQWRELLHQADLPWSPAQLTWIHRELGKKPEYAALCLVCFGIHESQDMLWLIFLHKTQLSHCNHGTCLTSCRMQVSPFPQSLSLHP